jgi:hypothetical protein
VLIDHVDGLPLEREFDVYGTAAIISDRLGLFQVLHVVAVFTILVLLFLRGALSNPFLHAVMAHKFQPRTVTAFVVPCRAFGVLEAISL